MIDNNVYISFVSYALCGSINFSNVLITKENGLNKCIGSTDMN